MGPVESVNTGEYAMSPSDLLIRCTNALIKKIENMTV